MRPLHRNAQPCVTAAPTSRTYKHIISSCIEELQVHLLYFPGNGLIVRSTVSIRLDVDDIINIVHDAMPQWIIRTEHHVFIRYQRQVFVQHFFAVHNRADLQQVECTRLILFTAQGRGKLNLHRAPHFLFTIFQNQLQDACQREYIMLQDIGKRDHLASTGIQTVTDHLVIRIVSRSDIA